METLRHALRRRTEAAHLATERAFEPLDPTTRAGLAGFLAAHDAALRAIAPRLGPAGRAAIPGFRAAIARDLATLGAPAPATDDAPACGETALPAAALGMSYVIAGSRLGAQLIGKQVASSPDPAVRRATDYLTVRVAGLDWPGILRQLNTWRGTGAERELVIGAALEAFGIFAREAQSREETVGPWRLIPSRQTHPASI